MLLRLLLYCVFTLLIIINEQPIFADQQTDFDKHMRDWNEAISLASKYLRDSEEYLKVGDTVKGCAAQEKASKYALGASDALSKVFATSKKKDDFLELESSLNRFKELGYLCNTIESEGFK